MAAFHILCTSTILLILTTCSHAEPSNSLCSYDQPIIKGVYYPSWARDNLGPSSIKTEFFTHIYYAFLIPNNVTFKFDIINNRTEAIFLKKFTSTLHAKKPPVRTLFSIGGGNVGHALFSRMASHPWSRSAFIRSSIQVAKEFGFDGIDLDWEFPQNSTDMENLAHLLDEWRDAVQKEVDAAGCPLLITAAVYYSADTFLSGAPRAYPVDSFKKNLDWINVMNYDYHGGWNKTATGAHAALFDPKSNLSTDFGIGSWIRAGMPRSKLAMGMPLYGRSWKLKDPRFDGVGAPAVDVGPSPDGLGALTYAEVVKFNKDHKAKVRFDSDTVSMYSVAGSSWIGYDDPMSVAVKLGFARALKLRGYFFWAINGDYNWTISKTASQVW